MFEHVRQACICEGRISKLHPRLQSRTHPHALGRGARVARPLQRVDQRRADLAADAVDMATIVNHRLI